MSTLSLPELIEYSLTGQGDGYVVILYNDDYHSFDDVIHQLQLATGFDVNRCVEITLEAHHEGRAIAFAGSQEECERVASILRAIRLQVETDRG